MNAIVIEQTQEQARLAFEVHRNAAIKRMRIVRSKLAAQRLSDSPNGSFSILFSFKSKSMSAPGNMLRLEIAFRMTGADELNQDRGKDAQPQGKEPEPAILVECAYEVDYELSDGFKITPEQVKAFKDGNAIFNVWPYFREYLQSSLQRMGLPALTAPFLRLGPKAKPRKRARVEDQD